MNIQRIAVIGGTGTLGQPVTKELIAAGYDVRVIARDPAKAADLGAASVVQADIFDATAMRKALEGMEGVYMNLSVKPDEKPGDPHTETHGIRNVISAAKANGIGRLALLSSLVKDYQGREGFDWWVFDVKNQAVRLLKESGVPSTVFCASSFFENFSRSQRNGTKIPLAGKSKNPMWFISGHDYGRQVAKAFAIDNGPHHRSYAVQGLESFTYDEAARTFAANYPAEKLKVTHAPMLVLRTLGLVSRKFDYIANIVEALNEYPEQFASQRTWDQLGKPSTTLAEWAKTAP